MRIAIAGGIGSGKSLVTEFLREMGAKVVVADEVNSELLKDPEYIALIAHNFPSAVDNNGINKKELASIVYSDEGKRQLLMSLAHPRIFAKMLSAYPESKVVFYEVPLLAEYRAIFDQVWFVDANLDARITRVIARDRVTEAYVKRVMELQKGEAAMRDEATCIISNNAGPEELREQVKALYCSILG